ncbi:hypothetical protein C2U70_02325 [Bradyrhizobium guangdongense]|uniref:dienelactone hydrolase family protein n=1 Tax=Bradyrhizobium guangdongense TaxID=1325090 RepID=UPI00164305AF|nr:dienelactone hydrolase family protein [Bradyrhizobium guangdongense]TPQ41831.1 hypothetical protein C2U70_02325 [Bradyrhizobium guangdongense]
MFVLMLWCVAGAVTTDARAAALERVAFESASQRRIPGGILNPGDGIFIGAIDDWTPAAECNNKVARWGNDGPSVELIVYPGAYHGFYYSHLQPGAKLFGHWLEYNGAAVEDANRRLRRFLDQHLK